MLNLEISFQAKTWQAWNYHPQWLQILCHTILLVGIVFQNTKISLNFYVVHGPQHLAFTQDVPEDHVSENVDNMEWSLCFANFVVEGVEPNSSVFCIVHSHCHLLRCGLNPKRKILARQHLIGFSLWPIWFLIGFSLCVQKQASFQFPSGRPALPPPPHFHILICHFTKWTGVDAPVPRVRHPLYIFCSTPLTWVEDTSQGWRVTDMHKGCEAIHQPLI